MPSFRKGQHGFIGRKVPTIDFDTEEDRDRAVRLLGLIENLAEEARNEGYAVEPLTERGMAGLTVAAFDPPHTKASAMGVAKMRGAASSSTSGKIPTEPLLGQVWDRSDLEAVARQMRSLKKRLTRHQED